MSQLPADGVLESVWLVEATYAPDAAETRKPFRAEHLAGIRERVSGSHAVGIATAAAAVVLIGVGRAL